MQILVRGHRGRQVHLIGLVVGRGVEHNQPTPQIDMNYLPRESIFSPRLRQDRYFGGSIAYALPRAETDRNKGALKKCTDRYSSAALHNLGRGVYSNFHWIGRECIAEGQLAALVPQF